MKISFLGNNGILKSINNKIKCNNNSTCTSSPKLEIPSDSYTFSLRKDLSTQDSATLCEYEHYFYNEPEEFNSNLAKLDDEEFLHTVDLLSGEHSRTIPFLEMDEQNIDRLASLSMEQFNATAKSYDLYQNNVFHLADADTCEFVMRYLEQDEINYGLASTNVMGFNPVNKSMFQADKLQLFCDNLESDNISKAMRTRDGMWSCPFYACKIDEFEIMLERLEPSHADELALWASEQGDNKNVLVDLEPDKLRLLVAKMSPECLEVLCRKQNLYGATPMHMQTTEFVEMFAFKLPKDSLREVIEIENGWWAKPSQRTDVDFSKYLK